MLLSALFVVLARSVERPAGKSSHAIGIDLGTTFSCVAVFENSRVEVIAARTGSRITPSIVGFRDGQRLVGEAARDQIAINPEGTVFSIKRLMGMRYSDPQLQSDLSRVTYKVISKDDHPFIEIPGKNGPELYSPEEISAIILSYEKTMAEEYLGVPVTNAVITIPAYFNDGQRKATLDAGKIAGLNVLQILNEPTAACIAYAFEREALKKRTLLVYDLGGGTFDVSVVDVEGDVYKVRAVNGDSHLGGEDFDARVVAYFTTLFREQTGKDVSGDRRALAKLRRQATAAKIALSQQTEFAVDIESLFEGEDFSAALTRARFEELCKDLFEKTIPPLQQVLTDATLRADEVDDVVLVGGSTRIPRVQKLVRDFFGGKEPARNINPDEAVAVGAALRAANLEGDAAARGITLVQVNPLSLGTELEGGFMSKIIPRNTKIPVTRRNQFTTVRDNQEEVLISVYEGENRTARANHLLGEFTLSGIPPKPKGQAEIEITYTIDANGTLTVAAVETASGAHSEMEIQWSDARLAGDALEQAIQRAAAAAEEEEALRRSNTARNALEDFLRGVSAAIAAGRVAGSAEAEAAVAAGLEWADENRGAPAEAIEGKRAELRRLIGELLGPGAVADDGL